MQLEKSELVLAAAKVGISKHQAEELWSALGEKAGLNVSKFDLSNVLYYFGSMIVIGAMGWFVGLAWDDSDDLCAKIRYKLAKIFRNIV